MAIIKCPKCGKEISDEAKFCSGCGTSMSNISMNKEGKNIESGVEKDKSDSNLGTNRNVANSKTKVIVIVALLAVIICAALFFGKSKSEKFLEMVKNGDTEQAISFYQNKLMDDSSELEKAHSEAVGEIASLVDDYADDKITYDYVTNSINVYSNFYVYEVTNAIQEIESLKESKGSFELAENKFALEDYYTAYEEYSKVIAEDINSVVAEEKKETCYKMIKDKAFASGEISAAEGDYSQAITVIEKDMEFFNEEDKRTANEVIDGYIKMFIDENMVDFDDALKSENYAKCFEIIDDIKTVVGNNNDRIVEMEKGLHSSFEEYISDMYNSALKNYDLEGCEYAILQGENLMPDSLVINELEVALQDYYPVELFDIKPFQSSTYFNSKAEATLDNHGNEHKLAYVCGGIYNKSADWKLDKKYNVITGMVGVPSGDFDCGVNGRIYIYGDDELIWQKEGIDASTAPENITIDVTGVDVLRIEMKGGSGPLAFCSVMVADFIVQKTP